MKRCFFTLVGSTGSRASQQLRGLGEGHAFAVHIADPASSVKFRRIRVRIMVRVQLCEGVLCTCLVKKPQAQKMLEPFEIFLPSLG